MTAAVVAPAPKKGIHNRPEIFLGISERQRSGCTGREGHALGKVSDRCIHSGEAGREGFETGGSRAKKRHSCAAPLSMSQACRLPNRRSKISWRTILRTPLKRWWTGCWPRRATANGGDGTGWMLLAMRIRPAMTRTTGIPTRGRYRDYVISAFNNDLPYDQFSARADRRRTCCLRDRMRNSMRADWLPPDFWHSAQRLWRRLTRRRCFTTCGTSRWTSRRGRSSA